MNRGTLLSLVNVSLVAGLVLAVTDVVAQTQPTTSTTTTTSTSTSPTLVSTQCGYGQITVCGTEVIGQQCSYVFGLTGDKNGAFGFNFGGMVCTSGGTQNRYKDFDSKTATGTCVIVRRPPADATGTTPPEDEGDWYDDGTEECY
jgi:hypothetical protein